MSQGMWVHVMRCGTPERYFPADAFDLSRSCALGRYLGRFKTSGLFRDLWQTKQDADLAVAYHPRYGRELGVGG
jgi:hypothetical protein